MSHKHNPSLYAKIFSLFRNEVEEYSNAKCKEDVIRELMRGCDTLLKYFQEQGLSPPEPLKNLDEKLWEWFSEPPEAKQLQEEISGVIKELSAEKGLSTEKGLRKD